MLFFDGEMTFFEKSSHFFAEKQFLCQKSLFFSILLLFAQRIPIIKVVAHRGQSRALFLRRRGRVQSYTPSAYSSQNTTLSHAASTDRKQTVIGQLTNHNLCGMFYTLRNTLFINLYSAFTKFGTLPNSKVIQKKN